MKIACPSCGFTREINTAKIPHTSTVATCPKCQSKFSFRAFNEEGELVYLEETQLVSHGSTPTLSNNEKSSQGDENNLHEQTHSDNISDDMRAHSQSTARDESENEQSHVFTSPLSPNPDEMTDEDKLKHAHTMYREQMRKIEELQKQGYTVQVMTMVPWEDIDSERNIVDRFFQTIVRSLFSSPAFFATMFRPLSISKAALFYIIIGVLQFVSRMLLFRFNSSEFVTEDAAMQSFITTMQEPSTLVLGLFIAPFVLILQLICLSALLTFIIKLIEPRSANFSLIARMLAYASSPGLLSIIPIIGDVVAMPWILFNIFLGCRYTLHLPTPKALLAVFAFMLFSLVAILFIFSSL